MSENLPVPDEPEPNSIEIVPDEIAEEVLGSFPEEEQETARRVLDIIAVRMRSEFSGPIPPPHLLKGYEDASKGSASRIIAMAESEQQHRHRREIMSTQASIANERWGLALGFILALTLILGGIGLLIIGRDIAGLVLIGGTAGTIAVTYLRSIQQGLNEQQEQIKQLEEGQKSDPRKDKTEIV
jgi:uncharacterized membrane protein